MTIRQIFDIPAMDQIEGTDDYRYPEEYNNQLCKFGDKYVLFKERSYEEFPAALIDIVIEASKQNQVDMITEEQIDMKMTDLVNDMHDNNVKIDEGISNFKSNTDDAMNRMNQKVEAITSKISNLQSPEAVKAIVSKELTSVYENYEKVIKKLIHEKAEELAKEIKEAGNKLDPMTVMMYKKMGMELPDIIQMAKSGLI